MSADGAAGRPCRDSQPNPTAVAAWDTTMLAISGTVRRAGDRPTGYVTSFR